MLSSNLTALSFPAYLLLFCSSSSSPAQPHCLFVARRINYRIKIQSQHINWFINYSLLCTLVLYLLPCTVPVWVFVCWISGRNNYRTNCFPSGLLWSVGFVVVEELSLKFRGPHKVLLNCYNVAVLFRQNLFISVMGEIMHKKYKMQIQSSMHLIPNTGAATNHGQMFG